MQKTGPNRSTSSSAVNGRPFDFCLHRHPVSVNFLYHARMILPVGGSFAYLARNARFTVTTDFLVWYSITQNDFPSERPFCHYLHSHCPAEEMRITMKNNLMGKKILSCSFYLYRFRKYMSYGFPIIHFCNPEYIMKRPVYLTVIWRSGGTAPLILRPGTSWVAGSNKIKGPVEKAYISTLRCDWNYPHVSPICYTTYCHLYSSIYQNRSYPQLNQFRLHVSYLFLAWNASWEMTYSFRQTDEFSRLTIFIQWGRFLLNNWQCSLGTLTQKEGKYPQGSFFPTKYPTASMSVFHQSPTTVHI